MKEPHLPQARAVVRMRRIAARPSSVDEPRIAQCGRDLGLVDDLLELLRAQERHGRHDDESGLERREPDDRHVQGVRAAQQDAVARHEAHLVHEHMRRAVHALAQFAVGRDLGRAVFVGPDCGPLAEPAFVDHPVEQFGRAIEARRIPDIGVVEQELRPLFGRRQVVAGERIDVSRGLHERPPESDEQGYA